MMKYKIIFSLLFLALVLNLHAQNKPAKKDVYNESVTVIAGYEPTLSDAFKINESPSIFDTVQRIPIINYTLNAKQFGIKFMPEEIRPAKVVGEPIARLYKNYAKVGLGTYLSPLAEIYFNTTRSKNSIWGAFAQHYSSWERLQDMGNSTFANTNVQLFNKYFWKKHLLNTDVFYTNNYYHYYGFTENFAQQTVGYLPDAKLYKQSINRFGINLLHQSFDVNEDWQHTVKLSAADMIDAYKANQMDVLANVDVNRRFHWFGETPQKAGINLDMDLDRTHIDLSQQAVSYTPASIDSINNNVQSTLSLTPYFRFSFYKINFNLGVKMALGIADKTDFYVYPAVKVDRSFLQEHVNVYLGMSGGLSKNSIHSLRLQNPYISNNVEREISNNKGNIFLGAITKPLKQLDIRAQIMYSQTKNSPMFGIDPNFELQNMYTVIYDRVNLFNALLELEYEYSSDLKMGIGGNYYNASTEKEPEYWYHPNFDVNLFAKYKIADKFAIGFEGKFVGPVKGFYYNDINERVVEKLQGRFDMSLSADYYYNKSLRFFWLLNNVASQRYYNWTHYPSQKFNTMIGLSYSF